ncbi:MAG: homoserine kinase [Methyloprofundus sp.]|nr:homoserine kinase [Methyloprofundus sp.]
MAVYTSLTSEQINRFLKFYQLPALLHYQGISAGIENTNYLINTKEGDFILTVYEHFSAQQAQCYLNLLQQLAALENYYPEPIKSVTDDVLLQVNNKSVALFKCLDGCSVEVASDAQIIAIAKALARLHLSSAQLEFSETNPKGLDWLQQSAKKVFTLLTYEDAQLLSEELLYQSRFNTQEFEQGVIHADLFKDNALFSGNCLTGFLDFYAACYDTFLLDIAIAVNDWCVDEQGVFKQEQYKIFVYTYQQIKPLVENELDALDGFLRRACLRFWLSRLEHKFNPKAGEITLEKSPERFRDLLSQHRKRVGS